MKNIIFFLIITMIATSCNKANNSANMKEEANKAKLQRFYDEVINVQSTAMIDSFCIAEFVDHNPDPGYTGNGIDDLKSSMKDFFTAFPDIRITPNFMIAQGYTVIAHVTMTGTNSGVMGGMPATNKTISIEGIDILVINDGKASERWGIFELMKIMQQMGILPEPGAMPEVSAK